MKTKRNPLKKIILGQGGKLLIKLDLCHRFGQNGGNNEDTVWISNSDG
jgi:hypothetical protein